MWIYELNQKKIGDHKFFYTFLIFVLPVIVLFLPYVCLRINHLSTYDIETWAALALAGSWAYLGPYLINKYFEGLDSFCQKTIALSNSTNDVIADTQKVPIEVSLYEITNEEEKNYRKRVWKFYVFWGGLITLVLLFFNNRLQDFAFFGFTDIYYWIALAYINFLLYLQSIGFSAIIMTFRIIKRIISNNAILDDVLEGSFEEGIEALGDFLRKTSLYFFTGIVFFPILIVFAKNQSVWLLLLIIIIMLVFIIAILSFFLYSYYIIRKCALKRKQSLIDEFRNIYNKHLKASFDKCNNIQCSILNELKIINANNHLNKLEQINVNPIHFSKTIITIFTIIFPALFFIKDMAELFSYLINL